jgi:cyclopropane fatty-acyl-phospholipid synthase-like methyltransferase
VPREGLRQRVLGDPRGFDLFQRLVGARRAKASFVAHHVRPRDGDRILDLGCGTGGLLELLPHGVVYVGVELDAAYVERARRRFGSRGTFVHADIATYEPRSTFDIVIAYGVLHHLEDQRVRSACRLAHRALHASGRVLFAEPCRTDEQGRLETALMNRDRGRYIRTPERYAELMREHFEETARPELAEDGYRIPYTFVILEARR